MQKTGDPEPKIYFSASTSRVSLDSGDMAQTLLVSGFPASLECGQEALVRPEVPS